MQIRDLNAYDSFGRPDCLVSPLQRVTAALYNNGSWYDTKRSSHGDTLLQDTHTHTHRVALWWSNTV
jgi:hypothetical protein